ncbi:MAG: hypothetical protein J6P75_06340 [Bacteroidales bacterium]|nr:hypothetical protein [Bacteroidales bacterium]
MKKERVIGMLAIGLLSLLGFSSCSPRMRPRRVVSSADTLKIPPIDTVRIRPNPGREPIKLMYGVPPVRFEKMTLPDKELKNESR